MERPPNIKFAVFKLLSAPDLDEALRGLSRERPTSLIKALLPLLYNKDEETKWRAVTALGRAIARLFEDDPESARNLMRRLLWSLNDESGGIGWGAPETLAQAMIEHEGLAHEFAHLLVSFITPGGNFLDHEPLLRGAVWGIGALARARPVIINEAEEHLIELLGSRDAEVRGLSAWALVALGASDSVSALEGLVADETEIRIWSEGGFTDTTVGVEARRALAAINRKRGG